MLRGTVVHGDGLGKGTGYPTANINARRSDIKFSVGIYAAEATLHEKVYKVALVIRDNPFKVEAYFIDYSGEDFYGEEITISPIQKVSELERYDSMDELKEKIRADVAMVTAFFADRV
jgi:riboflavin kinase/FMN adenylyltransferase